MCLFHVLFYLFIGVLGPSVLSLHKPFVLPTSIVIDDLHCIYLGVTKTILKLWFNSKFKRAPFYIGNKVHVLVQFPGVTSHCTCAHRLFSVIVGSSRLRCLISCLGSLKV